MFMHTLLQYLTCGAVRYAPSSDSVRAAGVRALIAAGAAHLTLNCLAHK